MSNDMTDICAEFQWNLCINYASREISVNGRTDGQTTRKHNVLRPLLLTDAYKLEKVAIVMHCNLSLSDIASAVIRGLITSPLMLQHILATRNRVNDDLAMF